MKEYLAYWGVEKPIFTDIVDNEGSLYINSNIKSIIERLSLLSHQGSNLMLITGPCGHGKTTLGRWFHKSLHPSSHEALLLALYNDETKSGWLLKRLCQFLETGNISSFDKKIADITKVFHGIDEIVQEGRKLTLIIDDAHKIKSRDALEEIHTLIGTQSATTHFLNILLIGTKELKDLAGASPSMKNRITFVSDIFPLKFSDFNDYLNFKISKSKLDPNVISETAKKSLFRHSKGIFSLINTIMENCFIDCYLSGKRQIDDSIVEKSVSLSSLETPTLQHPPEFAISKMETSHFSQAASPSASIISLTDPATPLSINISNSFDLSEDEKIDLHQKTPVSATERIESTNQFDIYSEQGRDQPESGNTVNTASSENIQGPFGNNEENDDKLAILDNIAEKQPVPASKAANNGHLAAETTKPRENVKLANLFFKSSKGRKE
ncbi:MAG: AAA family ATPase [Oligoflexales bacterium]|nr:AAA family ATPase [Oligoflexales bacterium]